MIGDLLQLMFIVLPILRLAGRRVRGWVDRHFVTPPLHDFTYTHGVALTVVGFGILGLVVFLGVHQALGSIEIALDAPSRLIRDCSFAQQLVQMCALEMDDLAHQRCTLRFGC